MAALATQSNVNIDAVLATIRQLESGGSYTIVTSGGSDACGAYQYISSTWQAMLYRTIRAGWLPQNTPLYSRACMAPPQVQDTVARYDVTTFLGSVNNNVSLVPLHWYYPAAIASWPAMANYTPPGNNISLGAYQSKWMNTYQSFAGAGSAGGNFPTNQGNPTVNNNTGIAYTYAQLEYLWTQAGGNPQNANIAAAVAMAESGGNPNAVSPSNDYGLWQINSVHGAQATLDVMGNARAAVAISNNGQNWGPWCTCWTDPKANCGHFLGPNPQPGSPAAKLIQNNVAPDSSAPINGTNAATGTASPQYAQELSWFDPQVGACSTLEWALNPGGCAVKQGGSEAQHLAGSVIDLLMVTFLNPILSIIAGGFGILGGGIIMLISLWEMVKDGDVGQAIRNTTQFTMENTGTQPVTEYGKERAAEQLQKRSGYTPPEKKPSKKSQQNQRRDSMRKQARRYQSTSGKVAEGAEVGAEAGAAAV